MYQLKYTEKIPMAKPGPGIIWKTIGLIALHCLLSGQAYAQWGIGIKVPGAKMHVHDGTILSVTPKLPPNTSPFYAPVYNDVDSVQHAFKWMHEKGAIRFLGKGFYSIGLDTVDAGRFSSAAGYGSNASGTGASSFGLRTYANGTGTFTGGRGVIAGGDLSFAQGFFTIADGPNTISMGTNLSNNYQTGSFIFGHATSSAQNTSDNEFRALFDGGYEFYSNAALTIGMILSPGNNAWTVVSDVRKKENFLPVQGSKLLKSILKMPLTSWNYKGQNPKVFRHYGPMAQDFFNAFGTDAHGTIGADTTINQADLDGVALVAIQELIKITDELEKQNDDMEAEVAMLRLKLSASTSRKAIVSDGIAAAKR